MDCKELYKQVLHYQKLTKKGTYTRGEVKSNPRNISAPSIIISTGLFIRLNQNEGKTL